MKRLASCLLLLLISCSVLTAQELTEEMKKLADNLYDAVNKGQHDKADALADSYLALCTSDDLRIGAYYAEAKHVKAHTAAAKGDYPLAQQIMDEVIATRLDARTARNDDRTGDAYFDRGSYHFRQQNTDQAIADLKAAADAYKKARKDNKYATALCQAAQYYKFRGAPGDAEQEAMCYEQAFPNVEKGTAEYLSVAAWMITSYNEQGKYDKASKLGNQLKKTAKKVFEKQPIRYADFLLSASVAEANTKQYAQALAYADEAFTIYEETGNTAGHNYAILLKNAADCHFHLQHYQEALSLYEKARPLLLNVEGEGGKVYQSCFQQLIATNARLGRTDLAQEYSQQQQEQLFSGVNDTTTLGFANTLATQAQMQADMGNFHEAASWGERALRRYEARGDSLQQALMLYTLSNYYTHLNQQERADSLIKLTLQLSHRRGFVQTEADALHQQAVSFYKKKQYSQADEVCRQALSLLRKANMASSTAYASILCDRALFQSTLDSLDAAIRLTHEALDLQTSILGPEHGDNVMLLFNLAIYHHRLGQMDSVAHYYHQAITLQTQLVRNNFSFQSSRQREHFWQRKNYLYQTAPLLATSPDKASPLLLTDIYNAQLFTKGILLNSEIDFRRILQKSADKNVLKQYDELKDKHAELQQCLEAKAGDGKERIPGLQHRISQLEYAIVRQCKAYGDFTQNLSLTVDSVCRSLRPGEAAIEFLEADIIYGGKPDRLYLALILRPGWDAPHACRLFFRSDMEELGYPAGFSVSELLSKADWQNKIYTDHTLGQLVWGKLLTELDGVTSIYFAPTSIFYQWGIEYMPIEANGTRISEKLNVHRLSSTKLLAQRTDSAPPFDEGTAVIYGGLEYENMTVAQMRAYHEMGDDEVQDHEDFTAIYAAEQQMADSIAILAMAERGATVSNLKGAEKEAEAIEYLFYNAGKDYKVFEDQNGTEESFKALSGRNVSLLHIATHGFSYPVTDKPNAQLDWLNPAAAEGAMPTDPLCYSGLLFAGCNNKLQHPADFPADIEDGILTAQEIAQLNLQSLRLTVLSACQTGTGMLHEDGVFGVQRGFKKAGAHTLVMSLWNVNDAATQLMMTSFYEALLSGQSRHEAFLKAQQTVRSAYPEPHYWAPFIMLDDI
ncbi:MAG: CHAT domain-containing protein [Bacteroidaceae bacterium]|nr:CHAT domain-containing protein [Bacteroidaceae bacterium]